MPGWLDDFFHNVVEAFANGGQIDNDGLRIVAELKGLERLNLVYTGISDKGLVHLRGLTKLKQLQLGGTLVSDAGIAELQKALPACEIIRCQEICRLQVALPFSEPCEGEQGDEACHKEDRHRWLGRMVATHLSQFPRQNDTRHGDHGREHEQTSQAELWAGHCRLWGFSASNALEYGQPNSECDGRGYANRQYRPSNVGPSHGKVNGRAGHDKEHGP